MCFFVVRYYCPTLRYSIQLKKKRSRHIGFEWVIPYVIPCEGYLVAMQFIDLTGGNFFVSSLTLLDGGFQV